MKPTKEELERLYNSGLSQREIGEMFGCLQGEIAYHMKKYGIRARNTWTDDEIEYLFEHLGTIKLETIAKNLGKTENAIKVKAYRLGISAIENTGMLTTVQLAEAVKVDRNVVTNNWIRNKGLKAQYRVVFKTRRIWLIDTNDFWNWAFENRSIVNFSRIEPNILGSEPDWVKLERKRDFKEIPISAKSKWTPEEDKKLKMLWNTQYTFKQIGEMIGRSEDAIHNRARRLKLPNRRIAIPWKDEEIQTLISMKLNGALDKEIAWELGREEPQVSWKRKELVKQGKLDWKYRAKVMEG